MDNWNSGGYSFETDRSISDEDKLLDLPYVITTSKPNHSIKVDI